MQPPGLSSHFWRSHESSFVRTNQILSQNHRICTESFPRCPLLILSDTASVFLVPVQKEYKQNVKMTCNGGEKVVKGVVVVVEILSVAELTHSWNMRLNVSHYEKDQKKISPSVLHSLHVRTTAWSWDFFTTVSLKKKKKLKWTWTLFSLKDTLHINNYLSVNKSESKCFKL